MSKNPKILLILCSILLTTACSRVEYAAQKKHYHLVPSYHVLNADIWDAPQKEIIDPNEEYRFDDALVSHFSITKEDPRQLGNVYLQPESAGGEEVVLEIRKERSGYKARTPLFFSTDTTDSQFALSYTRDRGMVAGVEFKVNLDFDSFWNKNQPSVLTRKQFNFK